MQRGVRAASTVRTTARTANKVHFSILNAKLRAPCLYLYLYLYLNWQNVLGTHHASAHGGSSDLIVKMLD